MQAVIFCCNHVPLPDPLAGELPFCMLPLAGKPLVERALESAVKAGCTDVILFQVEHPEQVEARLGKGEKWGVDIRYAYLSEFTGLGYALQTLQSSLADEMLVFLRLAAGSIPLHELLGKSLFFTDKHRSSFEDVFILQKFQLDTPGLAGAETGGEAWECLRAHGRSCVTIEANTERLVTAYDLSSYAGAHKRALEPDGLRLPTPGLDRSPGIRIGHGCDAHSTVNYNAPVLLGQDCQIAHDAEIGPYAALGRACVVEKGTRIVGSVVMDNTYVGRRLTIENAIVRKGLLVKLDTGTVLSIADAFLLGDTELSDDGERLNWLLQRVIAGSVLLLCSPLLGWMYVRSRLAKGRPRFRMRQVAGQERDNDLRGGKELEILTIHQLDTDYPLLARLPALWDVARGAIRLVGVELLSPEEAERLTEPWQRLRFKAGPGLINPWHALDRQDWGADEKRVMEGYYTQSRSLRSDMRLLWDSLRRYFF